MKLFAIGALALLVANPVCAQQKSRAITKSPQTTHAAQTKLIADLAQQVKDLEQRVQILEQGERQRSVLDSSRTLRPDLSQVRLQLAGFDCTSEFNKAAAVALARGEDPLTYQGGAAMDCTQRLKALVYTLVETLEKQQ